MRLAAIAAACNGATGRLDLQFSLKLIHYCQRVWLGLRRAIYLDTSQNYFHLDCRHLDCRFGQDKSDVLIVGPVTDNPVFQRNPEQSAEVLVVDAALARVRHEQPVRLAMGLRARSRIRNLGFQSPIP